MGSRLWVQDLFGLMGVTLCDRPHDVTERYAIAPTIEDGLP
ncbi:MAG TPA: hypothetical protein V6D20_06605 [Candidatus Obscuribacterales bacterium]